MWCFAAAALGPVTDVARRTGIKKEMAYLIVSFLIGWEGVRELT